jgi:type II secretory ATPase GspE/PulE/Tfp pilus assembly ATPase PilB-like protein
VGRLLDMDVEPFLVASVLEGILAQRLGRRLCQSCKTRAPIDETLRHRITPAEQKLFPGMMGWVGAGCDKCDNSGFKGRLGFFEVLLVTPAMRGAITDGRTASYEILATALPEHVSMRGDGLIKASEGQTTVDEVLRATQDAEGLISAGSKK